MAGKENTSSSLGVKGKLIVFVIITILTVFFCGHLGAVIDEGAGVDNWPDLLLKHILSVPLDFVHVNYYVLYFTVCIYALVFFMMISRRELPRAEMKGIEHGSNDFQTEEERKDFLAKNTTPIYSLELYEFESKDN